MLLNDREIFDALYYSADSNIETAGGHILRTGKIEAVAEPSGRFLITLVEEKSGDRKIIVTRQKYSLDRKFSQDIGIALVMSRTNIEGIHNEVIDLDLTNELMDLPKIRKLRNA